MGLIATDRVWAPVFFVFGVPRFQSNDFLAFSLQYVHLIENEYIKTYIFCSMSTH